mgnify:FL=1
MAINDRGIPFPSKDRPDKEKDSKYIRQWLRAMWRSGGVSNFYGRPPADMYAFNPKEDTSTRAYTIYEDWFQVQRNYDFMKALVDASEYLNVHSGDSVDANNILQQRGIKAVIPKDYLPRVTHLLNKLGSRPTDFICTVLDPDSNSAMMSEKYMAKARIKTVNDPRVKPLMGAAGIAGNLPADHPKDEDEWEAWEWKSKTAMDAELIVEAAMNFNDYETMLQPLAAEDILASGMVCGTVVLNAMGAPKIILKRRTECILPWTADSYKTPMPWGAIVEYLTLEDIMGRAGNQISNETYAKMSKQTQGLADLSYGQGLFSSKTPSYNSGRFTVVTGWFIDYNHMDRVVDPDGFKRPAKDGEEPTYKVPYQVVYQGSLVIDAQVESGVENKFDEDISWDCGLSFNMERQQNQLYETRIPLFAIPVMMENMRIKPLMSIVQEHYNAVVKIFLEIENLLNMVIPPGYILSPDSLVGISDNGKPAKMSDVIKTKRNTGVMTVNTMSVVDPNNTDMPRQMLPIQIDQGMIPEFGRLVELYEWKLQKLAEILTIPPASLGQIEDREAVRNVQQQLAVANSAHKHLTDALDKWKVRISEMCYYQVQNALKSGKNFEGYALLYGDSLPKQVKLTAGTDLKSIGIRVQERLTTEERAAIMQMLANAKAANKLNEAQYLKLQFVPNLKKAVKMMEREIAKNEELAHKRNLEVQQVMSQGNADAAKVQIDGIMQKTQLEAEAEMNLANIKGEMQLRNTQVKSEGDLEKLAAMFQMEFQKIGMQLSAQNEDSMAKLAAQIRMQMMGDETKKEIAEMDNETKKEISESRPNPKN